MCCYSCQGRTSCRVGRIWWGNPTEWRWIWKGRYQPLQCPESVKKSAHLSSTCPLDLIITWKSRNPTWPWLHWSLCKIGDGFSVTVVYMVLHCYSPLKSCKVHLLKWNVLTSLCNVFFFLWDITRVYGVLGSYVSLCIDAVLSYFMYLLKYQLFPDGVLFVCLCFIYSYYFLFACIVTGCTKGRNI